MRTNQAAWCWLPGARRRLARSVRHEYRNRHLLQHTSGHPSQNHLARLGVAVAAHHDQRSGNVGDVRQDGVGNVDVGRRDCHDLNLDVVRARCFAISAPRISFGEVSVFSFNTINRSTVVALTNSGSPSLTARVAARLPSQQHTTWSSFSPSFWMYGTTIRGRPGSNSEASIMSSLSTTFGSDCINTPRSNRRASVDRTAGADAPTGLSRRCSAEIRLRLAAASKRSIAAKAAFSLSAIIWATISAGIFSIT